MSRPRTPTRILELRNSFREHPSRRREDPDIPGALGDPPSYFCADLSGIWQELAEQAPVGVLTSADRILVEVVCHLTLKLRVFGIDRKDGLCGAEQSQLTTILRALGCSPSDRSKVSVQPRSDEDDELAEFLQG
jgi:phage terminase small subunit